MSKRLKNEAKEKRLAEKRRRKTSNKAQYAQWQREGVNTKSRRSKKQKVKRTKGLHEVAHCGNPACDKCFVTVIKNGRAIARLKR